MQRITRIAALASTSAALVLAAVAQSASAAPGLRLAALPSSFDGPVWVGGAGDGTSALYVAEQRGMVWKVVNGRKSAFLNLQRSVLNDGEQGLLSIAFAHDFRTSGLLYTWSNPRANVGQVRQFRVRSGRVVPNSGRVIITVPLSPPTETNHNGGTVWSMKDGSLLVSVGDGGGGGDPNQTSQNMTKLMGKMLRIVPRANGGYTVPATNPFVQRSGARKEIWALGLRNPWRFSVDAPTGDIWIGDVGQGAREEVDLLRAGRPVGANFGWSRYEGLAIFDATHALAARTPYVRPRITYGRSGGECSVTGGMVYRGPVRALRGWYLYGDFCGSRIRMFSNATGRGATAAAVEGIVHFGSGVPSGDVYVASVNSGKVYKIVAPA